MYSSTATTRTSGQRIGSELVFLFIVNPIERPAAVWAFVFKNYGHGFVSPEGSCQSLLWISARPGFEPRARSPPRPA